MKKHPPPAPLHLFLADPLPDEVNAMLWRLRRADDVRRVAIMPDVHLSHDVCVGTVFATSRMIYPAAIGGDIGCGMAALAFDAQADRVRAPAVAAAVIEALRESVPVIRRHSPPICPWLTGAKWSHRVLQRVADRDGRFEFGTLGRGNHFLELQEDEADGRLWAMVHSGSRCMGQAVRDHHLLEAQGSSFGLRFLDSASSAGRAYLHDLAWARSYAAVNRVLILRALAGVLQDVAGIAPPSGTLINRDHNHVVREVLGGSTLWVHRKGANRARHDEPGIIPGSMGTFSVHTAGRGSVQSLCSSSHGSGRSLSRESARRRFEVEDLELQLRGVHYDVRQADRWRDEAPAAYRDLSGVLRAQRQLVRVVRRLRPVLSYKG
jgi:tRNA-splicing ligase RtcB